MINLNTIDESNRKGWGNHVRSNVITYPDERLVGLMSRRLNQLGIPQQPFNALDIGFGSGRHLKLCLDKGINAYGIEYAEEAIIKTKITLGEPPGLKELWYGDYRNFEFPIKYDFVITWGSIVNHFDDIKKMANLIKEDGSIFLNIRTKDNWMFGLGEEVGRNTYLLDDRAKNYCGSLYCFIDRQELDQIVKEAGLIISQIERVDLWKDEMTEQNSWLICEIRKN